MKGALGNAMFSWKVTPFLCLLLFLCLGSASLGRAQQTDGSATTTVISTVNVTSDEAINETSTDNSTLSPETTTTTTVTTQPEEVNTTTTATTTSTSTTTSTTPVPVPTTENSTTSSSTIPSTSTDATTPTQPTTVTTPNSTTPPPPVTTESPSTVSKSTEPFVTTASLATKTPHTTDPGRRFDAPSFIGGIVLSVGLLAIVYVGYKFYRARTEHNYHTLHETIHM